MHSVVDSCLRCSRLVLLLGSSLARFIVSTSVLSLSTSVLSLSTCALSYVDAYTILCRDVHCPVSARTLALSIGHCVGSTPSGLMCSSRVICLVTWSHTFYPGRLDLGPDLSAKPHRVYGMAYNLMQLHSTLCSGGLSFARSLALTWGVCAYSPYVLVIPFFGDLPLSP